MNNLIQETAEMNNISIDMIHDGLAAVEVNWSREDIIKVLGHLGNSGIHGEHAHEAIHLIAERFPYYESATSILRGVDIKKRTRIAVFWFGEKYASSFLALVEGENDEIN